MAAFSTKSKKSGKTYYLHTKEVTLAGNRKQKIYYFAGEATKDSIDEIPKGYEVQIRPRSGLALNFQITVLNTPGTIDSDYRNEIKVILINHSDKPFIIEPKMRIAQMIVAPYFKADFFKTEVLEASLRREGFGSTGAY